MSRKKSRWKQLGSDLCFWKELQLTYVFRANLVQAWTVPFVAGQLATLDAALEELAKEAVAEVTAQQIPRDKVKVVKRLLLRYQVSDAHC
eukprot:1180326-Prorocentrum_minimum.AAC.2